MYLPFTVLLAPLPLFVKPLPVTVYMYGDQVWYIVRRFSTSVIISIHVKYPIERTKGNVSIV